VLTPKTASVVPPGDKRLKPETCRGLRHNKVIVKLKVEVMVGTLFSSYSFNPKHILYVATAPAPLPPKINLGTHLDQCIL
jgi:hypothetical protein